MSIQNINRGTSANDGTGDPARSAALKINENFAFLYNAQSDFKTVIGRQLDSTNVQADAAIVINASAPFTFPFANLGYLKYVEFVNGDIFNIYFFKITKVGGGASFGSGGTVSLTQSKLFLTGQKLKSVEDFQSLNTTVTEDFGDIGTTSLIDYVNGLSPAVSIQATSVGATILKAIVNGEQESYLFKGAGGDYGAGALQLTASDLEQLNESTNVSVPIDSALSDTSGNPLENRVIKAALDALQNEIDNVGGGTRTNTTVTKTNDTYTLQASDADKRLFIPAPCTVIVPNGLAANLEFQGKQIGVGDVEFVAETGGTLNVNSAFQKFTEGEHAYFGIITLGGDVADLLGTLKLAV